MKPSVIASLEQQARGKWVNRFDLYDDGRVMACTTRGPERHDTPVDLSRFELHPQRHRKRSRVAYAIFIAGMTGIVATIITFLFTSWDGVIWALCVPASVLFGLITWLAWRSYVRNTFDVLVFVDAVAGQNLALQYGVPDQAAFDAYVSKLEGEVVKHSNLQSGPASGDSVARQMRELATLKAEGFLTDDEFKTGKQLVLDGRATGGSIGFASS